MRVKIINATSKKSWYKPQIGNVFNVDDYSGDYYKFFGDDTNADYVIRKCDCEILPEENPQPEPFDLARALKGEKVCITCGILVDKFTFVDSIQMFVGEITTDERYRYQAPTANTIKMWDKAGRVYSGFSDGDQLYMAPKEPQVVTLYINVYPSSDGNGYITGVPFDKEADAIRYGKQDKDYLKTIPITFTI